MANPVKIVCTSCKKPKERCDFSKSIATNERIGHRHCDECWAELNARNILAEIVRRFSSRQRIDGPVEMAARFLRGQSNMNIDLSLEPIAKAIHRCRYPKMPDEDWDVMWSRQIELLREYPNSVDISLRQSFRQAEAASKASKYLIWSNEHRLWWRADRKGYTNDLSSAGRYSRDESISICSGSRDGWGARSVPPEVPVLAADAEECERRFQWMVRGVRVDAGER